MQHPGGCLCGHVRFTLTGPLRPVIYCHCNQCRKQTGHYLAATAVDLDRLALEHPGRVSWYSSSPEAMRGFCAQCGSGLFWQADGRDSISVLAGSLDDPSVLEQDRHIYMRQQGGYYVVCDGLPASD